MARDRIFGEEVKKQETRAHSFIKTIVHTLSPNKYDNLVTRTWRQAFDYLFSITFFLVFILFLLSIYKLAGFQSQFGEVIGKFDKLEMDVDFELAEPIQFGRFVMDNERNYSDEKVLITQDGIVSKSIPCLLLDPVCVFEDRPELKDSESLKDIRGYGNELGSTLALMLVLMLPGLLLFFLLYYTLKYLIVITLAFCIAFIVTRIARYEISPKQLYLAGLYSATVMILLEIISFYFMAFFWVPVLAYLIMYTVSIMMVGDREHVFDKERK
jgi:hypothetical protein